jgi:hypothetical protein
MRQTGRDLSTNGLGLHLEPSVVDFHSYGLFDINVKGFNGYPAPNFR